jgi:hypothetical protein
MDFPLCNLSVLAYANGFTLWHYKDAAEGRPAATAPSFFAQAGDILAAGDMILVSSRAGGRVLCVLPDQNGIRTESLS